MSQRVSVPHSPPLAPEWEARAKKKFNPFGSKTPGSLPGGSFQYRARWLGGVAIVLLTFAAYSSAIQGGFIWDDDDYVTENHLLASSQGLWQIWTTTKSPQYYPLVFTTFWVERRLWGLSPIGYHAVNVSLHALNAFLVWRLLYLLEIPGAWMVGAIFAVHPVHVESVAWISERKNVLSGLFYLLALGGYLRFQAERRWRWYAGSLGLFILALLSKTVVSTLPIVLVLVRYLKGWSIGRRELLELVPFLAIGGAMGLVTKWYEGHIGASGPDWNFSAGERLLIAGRALFFYLIKLLWPVNLMFNYPRWRLDVRDPIQWSWVLGAVVVGLLFWRKRQAWGRGPLVGLAFFSVSLAPALGFFNVYPMKFSFVADHFQYLASIGAIAVVVGSAAWGMRRRTRPDAKGGKSRPLAWVAPALGSLVLVILVSLTWKQGHVYHDLKTLWQDTLDKNADSWLAHSWLGTAFLREGDLNRALEHNLLSLRINPKNEYAHNNLGVIMTARGRQEEALEHFQQALQIRPEYPEALASRGILLAAQGRLEEAIHDFLSAVQLKPDFPELHYQLGYLYARQGRLEEAIREFLTAVQLKPDYLDAHYNLGNAYRLKGLTGEAKKQFEIALKLKPDFTPAQKALEALGF
jgi:tetratricopeptide (TPR) repeat protein